MHINHGGSEKYTELKRNRRPVENVIMFRRWLDYHSYQQNNT